MAFKKILAWIVSRHPHGRSRNARTYLRNVNSELLYLEFTWRQKNSLPKTFDVSKNPWAVRKVAIKFKHVLKRTQFSVVTLDQLVGHRRKYCWKYDKPSSKPFLYDDLSIDLESRYQWIVILMRIAWQLSRYEPGNLFKKKKQSWLWFYKDL